MGRLGAVLASVLIVAVAAAAAGGAAAPKRETLHAYVSCNSKGKGADVFCIQGDKPVAVFTSNKEAKVPYEFCFRAKGERRHCKDRHTKKKGQRSRTVFDVDGPDTYKLSWSVEGRVVERDSLLIRDRSMLIIGDSMGEGTEPYLPGALPGWRVEQNVARSRHVNEGISILRSRGGLPSVIVMSLGGNDDPAAASTFQHYVDEARQIAGKTRCIVWPNVVVPPRGGVGFSGYNEVLDDTARKHDNFRVLDWVKIVNEHSYWLASDGVHVTATGYQFRARAIARQVESC